MAKDTIKIVIIGHVDHGKSTLIGRMLLDTESLPKEKLQEVKRISKELGKGTELAYLVDQLKEEREQNITIDTAQIFFGTKKRNYVIIDAPGHVEFIKNMITGASLADAAVLIVDAREGVMEQTRRHAYLINMLGLKNVIVVFNKMDLVEYGEQRFEEVKAELTDFLNELGVTPLNMIPVSARVGDNIKKNSKKLNWYKGPTFLKALDSVAPEKSSSEVSFRFPVQDLYEIDGENVIVGRVAAGSVKVGQRLKILPVAREATLKKIKVYGEKRKEAKAGENIGLILDEPLEIKRGDMIALVESAPEPKSVFRANLFWMANRPLELNRPLTLRCATQEVECVAEKIENRVNSSTLEIIEAHASSLMQNEAAVVTFRTTRPIVLEDFGDVEELGRFVIEHDFIPHGAGIVTR